MTAFSKSFLCISSQISIMFVRNGQMKKRRHLFGLALDRRQAIIWTNESLFYRHIYASPGSNWLIPLKTVPRLPIAWFHLVQGHHQAQRRLNPGLEFDVFMTSNVSRVYDINDTLSGGHQVGSQTPGRDDCDSVLTHAVSRSFLDQRSGFSNSSRKRCDHFMSCLHNLFTWHWIGKIYFRF